MSIKLKFNGGNAVLVFSGTGTATLESLGLTTRSEVYAERARREAAEAELAKRDAKEAP